MLMESLLKFAKYFWSVTEKNSILLDNFRSRPVGMRVNRWWLNFHFCLKHVFKACKLSHWALNTLNRTQRGWHCSRKAFRHIRRARTMWEPVFSNIKPFSPRHETSSHPSQRTCNLPLSGNPRASYWPTPPRAEDAEYWRPDIYAWDIHGYIFCCGSAL